MVLRPRSDGGRSSAIESSKFCSWWAAGWPTSRAEALAAGAIGYLLKDSDPRDLIVAVRAAADGHAPLDTVTQLLDAITLLPSELVTNAIVHADASPDVTDRLLVDRVHVEVADTRMDTVRAQALNDTSTSGRGLALVDALASTWGSVALPEGKIVSFDVARS